MADWQFTVATVDGAGTTHTFDGNDSATFNKVMDSILDAVFGRETHLWAENPFVLYRSEHIVRVEFLPPSDEPDAIEPVARRLRFVQN